MKKLIRVKSVKYIDGYKLRLTFTNGKIKVVDMAYIFKNNAGYYLEPLRDLERFKEVYCDYGTICWPNGADFCPDVLYATGQGAPKKRNFEAFPKTTETNCKQKESIISCFKSKGFVETTLTNEGVAKLHSGGNSRSLHRFGYFTNHLRPKGYVDPAKNQIGFAIIEFLSRSKFCNSLYFFSL